MIDTSFLLISFEAGLVLSIVLSTFLYGLLWINPEIMLNDYPPAIRKKFGPMTSRTKQQHIIASIVFVAILLIIVVWSFSMLRERCGGPYTFALASIHAFIMFMTFNLVDWLFLDWFCFVALRPKFIVLPGTEGMKDYGDYWFHFRGFLIGTAIILISAPLVGGIAILVQNWS